MRPSAPAPDRSISPSRAPARRSDDRGLPRSTVRVMDWLQLANVLVAPVAGLLGAYMGVRLTAGREDKRLDRQESSARTTRLLDHKREAHANLIAATASYETAYTDFHRQLTFNKPSDGGVYAALHGVLMFASAQAAEKARSLCLMLPGPDEAPLNDARTLKVRDARYEYLDAVRADVGIEGDDLMRPG